MGYNIGGAIYEQKVRVALEEAIRGSKLSLSITGDSGAFNRHTNDLSIITLQLPTDIEIKRARSQMGERSYTFSPDTNQFTSTGNDFGFEAVYNSVLKHRTKQLKELLAFFKQYPYHSHLNSIPCRVTRQVWQRAIDADLIHAISGSVNVDQKFIHQHYQAKHVYYMQIENYGLYHLGKNPLSLPVPELIGDVNIEVRMKRSGSKYVRSIGERAVYGSLISVGRLNLKTCLKSPYSLDDQNSIRKLFRR